MNKQKHARAILGLWAHKTTQTPLIYSYFARYWTGQNGVQIYSILHTVYNMKSTHAGRVKFLNIKNVNVNPKIWIISNYHPRILQMDFQKNIKPYMHTHIHLHTHTCIHTDRKECPIGRMFPLAVLCLGLVLLPGPLAYCGGSAVRQSLQSLRRNCCLSCCMFRMWAVPPPSSAQHI